MKELLKHLVESTGGSKEEPTPWPAAVILTLLAIIVGGVMLYLAVMSRRKYAAQAHQLDVLQNEGRQKEELYDKLEEGDKHKDVLSQEIRKLSKERTSIRKEMLKLDAKRREFKKTLSHVTSWDDVA